MLAERDQAADRTRAAVDRRRRGAVSADCFPRLRWAAVAWMAVYVPAYALAYGFANFLFLCNLAVILVAIGIWTCSRLLLSSQALAVLIVSAVWMVDVASRLLTGSHLIGATEYMWEPQWPLFTRLLSLYHVMLPVLLLVVLRRIGYDRRGYLLQSAHRGGGGGHQPAPRPGAQHQLRLRGSPPEEDVGRARDARCRHLGRAGLRGVSTDASAAGPAVPVAAESRERLLAPTPAQFTLEDQSCCYSGRTTSGKFSQTDTPQKCSPSVQMGLARL